MNGIYVMYFTGAASSGHGLVILRNGTITGADAVGGLIDGTYAMSSDGKTLSGTVKFKAPAGGVLVTGAILGADAPALEIPLTVPADLGNGKPLTLNTPTGPINIIIKRLRGIDE